MSAKIELAWEQVKADAEHAPSLIYYLSVALLDLRAQVHELERELRESRGELIDHVYPQGHGR